MNLLKQMGRGAVGPVPAAVTAFIVPGAGIKIFRKQIF